MATLNHHGDLPHPGRAGASPPAAVLPCLPGLPPAGVPTTHPTGEPRSACRRCASGFVLFWLTLLGLPWGWIAPAAAQGAPGGTVLITETFQDTAVLTPGFTAQGATCLT